MILDEKVAHLLWCYYKRSNEFHYYIINVRDYIITLRCLEYTKITVTSLQLKLAKTKNAY